MTGPKGVRVVFMGSPEFAVPSLRALHSTGFTVVLAVSQPDRKAGRGGKLRAPAVKEAAVNLGIPTFQPESMKDPTVVETLASAGADLFVVAAYGKILPRTLLAIPPRGSVNVHASLLPRWRGASPITAAILAGDAEAGVSIMEVAPKMDAGAVISRRATEIGPRETAGELENRLAVLGGELLVETLPGWLDGSITSVEQDESLVTYCSLISKSDGHLAAGLSASEAERAVRAYNPWPGAYVEYRGERLAIWAAHVAPNNDARAAGSLGTFEGAPAVAFTDGVLVLDEVQRVGARRVPGAAFVNGERGNLESVVTLRD